MRKGIQEFFTNKNVLITGGTGLVGVSLVEKLLRAFPKIGTINLVVRPKNGETLSQRASTYFDQDAFIRLKQTNDDFQRKIVWLEGDISKPKLGLNPENLKHISETVNVIYHSAATVRFIEPLSNAINMNLCGTNEVFKIAKTCQHLDCFMHISTAFVYHEFSKNTVHDECNHLREDPLDLIEMHDTLSREEMDVKAKVFLEGWPNTYLYTKNAAENLLHRSNEDLKIGVFRPGSISEAYKEPFPYWMINSTAFSAILRKAHTGLMFDMNPNAAGTSTPVDLCTNALIAATCDAAASNKGKTKFYTFSANKPNWYEQYRMYMKNVNDPWLMFGSLRYRFLSHLKDLALEMHGKKGVYVKDVERHEKMIGMLQYFFSKDFTFTSRNIDALWGSMDEEEKSLFFFKLDEVRWKDYFENMFQANRKHLVDVTDFQPTLQAQVQSP